MFESILSVAFIVALLLYLYKEFRASLNKSIDEMEEVPEVPEVPEITDITWEIPISLLSDASKAWLAKHSSYCSNPKCFGQPLHKKHENV
jgi:hypothetical protein